MWSCETPEAQRRDTCLIGLPRAFPTGVLVCVVILSKVNIIQPSGTNLTLADGFITIECEKKFTPSYFENSIKTVGTNGKHNNSESITNENGPVLSGEGFKKS
jgi:hypothetical protein